MGEVNYLEIGLDKLMEIDEKLCTTFVKINHFWVRKEVIKKFASTPDQCKRYLGWLDQQITVCGSMKEGTSICRWFHHGVRESGIITLELDSMYCLGEISPKENPSLLETFQDKPGFYKLKRGAIDFFYPNIIDPHILGAFSYCGDENPRIVELLKEFKSEKHEYVRIDLLFDIEGRMVVNGKKIVRKGPSIQCEMDHNHSLFTCLKEIRNVFFPEFEFKKYTFSAIDIRWESEENADDMISVSDIDVLYRKAFPKDHSPPNAKSLSKLFHILIEDYERFLPTILSILLSDGTMPQIEVKEFGTYYFDNVASLKLTTWPANAAKFLDRKGKHWPPEHLVKEVISAGCHIVPKSFEGGDISIYWRISFSQAEVILTKALSNKYRKSFLLAKCIYYSNIVSLETDGAHFPSYFLKTASFNLLEKHPAEWFESKSTLEIVSEMYHILHKSFHSGYMENIFVSKMNILSEISETMLLQASMIALKIAKDPIVFVPKHFWHLIEIGKGAVEVASIFLAFADRCKRPGNFAFTRLRNFLFKFFCRGIGKCFKLLFPSYKPLRNMVFWKAVLALLDILPNQN